MGDIIPYKSPTARRDKTSRLGMVVFLASWGVMFACLFFAYGFLRSSALEWPPSNVPRLPVAMPALNTLLLVLSSVALHLGMVAAREGRGSRIAPLVGGATVMGVVFLGLQLVVWRSLWLDGLRPATGTYASVFYALTVFHAVHVLVGAVALGGLAVKALGGAYTPARYLSVRMWTWYWHFVGVVWLGMFVTVYVL